MTPAFKYQKCQTCHGLGTVKGKRKPQIICPECKGKCEILILKNGKPTKKAKGHHA